MDLDSLENHIRTLSNQHIALGRQIEKILAQKSWDEYEVETMKKKKLQIKDKLSKLHKQRYDMMQESDWE